MIKKSPRDIDLNLADLTIIFFKNKIFIILFCILGSVGGHLNYKFFNVNKDGYFAESQLSNPPPELFMAYEEINTDISFRDYFNSQFHMRIMQLHYLDKFIQEKSKIELNDFSISENEVSIENFKKSNFEVLQMDEGGGVKINNEFGMNQLFYINYIVEHPNNINGVLFFTQYIEYIKNITLEETKNLIRSSLSRKIQYYSNALEISYDIGLVNPWPMVGNDNTNIDVSFEEFQKENLYYRGSKVLSKQIEYYEEMLSQFDNTKIDYNIFNRETYQTIKTSYSYSNYLIYGFLLGLVISCVSLTIIYILRLEAA
tara:strand:- start:336 stop:1277 length:942 start_codon:yes stop_codon:yes gene_type:complete